MSEVPSKQEQVRTERREERQQQILEAALAVFSKKGFHAANVSDVAAEAGVSQGTIYWYFESKEELLNAALLSVLRHYGDETEALLSCCDTAEEKLRALGRTLEDFSDMGEGIFALFVSYWASSPRREEVARLWSDLLAQYKDMIVAIVQEGVRNDEFRAVDAESLVWALLAAFDGLAAYVMFMPDLDLKRINGVFVNTVIAGLKAGANGG